MSVKRKILDIIFWIALIVGIIMILWRIFGESPTDLAIITPFIVMALMKIWSNSLEIRKVGYQVKLLSNNTRQGFDKVREDFEKIRKDINNSKLNRRK